MNIQPPTHGQMTVIAVCPFEGTETKLKLDAEAYHLWRSGELVQHAFPTLTSAQREALITGICEECWQEMFESLPSER
jgi:hypothetical protein